MSAPTFYLFHGEDDLSRDEAVASLRAKLVADTDPATAAMNSAQLDGAQTSLAELQAACEAFPFLADNRLVIVTGMVSALKGKPLKALAAYLPTLPDWARLVLVEKKALSERNPVVKAARDDPHGYEKTFHPPKNATAWIKQRAPDYGVKIDAAAAAALAEVVGSDLRAADNELSKLAAYVAGARPIQVDDVSLLTSYVAEANIFAMIDAIVQGQGKQAAAWLHQLLEKQEPLSIMGMVIRQFRLLLLTKTHLAQGGAVADLAQAIDVHPYAARKLPAQSRKFSMDQLEAFYRRLLDYDMQIKTGQIDAELALDLLVAVLAQ